MYILVPYVRSYMYHNVIFLKASLMVIMPMGWQGIMVRLTYSVR